MGNSGLNDMMWTVGLLGYPFAERVRAVARHGYTAMSANAWELEDVLRAKGVDGLRALRAVADEHGVRLAALEPVTAWLPASDSAILRRVDMETIELLGETMGVEALLAAGYPPPGLGVAEVASAFAELCALADQHGWTPALEFTPNSGIRSLAAAREVLERAGSPSGRLVFDTWHFFRGEPDFAVLDATPGELISFVQVNDAAAEVVGTLAEDTRNRKLPGQGDLDIVGALRRLHRIGALSSVGPEVFRPLVEGQSADDAVAELARTMDEVLAAAGVLEASGR